MNDTIKYYKHDSRNRYFRVYDGDLYAHSYYEPSIKQWFVGNGALWLPILREVSRLEILIVLGAQAVI